MSQKRAFYHFYFIFATFEVYQHDLGESGPDCTVHAKRYPYIPMLLKEMCSMKHYWQSRQSMYAKIIWYIAFTE